MPGSLVGELFALQHPKDTPMVSIFPRRGSNAETRRIREILRKETVGGILLVAAASVAILWANSPWSDTYFAMRDFEIGYEPVSYTHLDVYKRQDAECSAR